MENIQIYLLKFVPTESELFKYLHQYFFHHLESFYSSSNNTDRITLDLPCSLHSLFVTVKELCPPNSKLQDSPTFSIFSDWIDSVPSISDFSSQLISSNVLSNIQSIFPTTFQYQLQFLVESILTYTGFFQPMIKPEIQKGFIQQVCLLNNQFVFFLFCYFFFVCSLFNYEYLFINNNYNNYRLVQD